MPPAVRLSRGRHVRGPARGSSGKIVPRGPSGDATPTAPPQPPSAAETSPTTAPAGGGWDEGTGLAPSPNQRYVPLTFHARGGLGEVWRARDAELGRNVALKRILDAHADQPESRRRFLLEAEIT